MDLQSILVVVDMQADFLDGTLGTEQAQGIVAGVCARIRVAHERKEALWLLLDTHDETYMDTQEGAMLPVAHCVKGTPGWALDPRVEAAAGPAAQRVEKVSFGSPRLVGALCDAARASGRADGGGLSIELCGLCTDICVVSNALMIKASLPEARLSVDAALCAGVTPESHEAALSVMRSCQVHIKKEE